MTGWDIVERFTRDVGMRGDVEQTWSARELEPDVVSHALFFELERPPWWRELDAQRRALKQELAA